MADEIKYEEIQYEDGQILEAAHMNRVERYIADIYSILNAKPEIHYEPIQYSSLGNEVRLMFRVTARGDISVVIKKGINIIYNKKTSDKSFDIQVSSTTNKIETQIYTIEVQDNFGNSTSATIENRIIDANIIFEPEIQNSLVIGYTQNNIANLNVSNKIIFTVKGEEPKANSVGLQYRINNEEYQDKAVTITATSNVAEKIYYYEINIPNISLGTITQDSDGPLAIQFRAYMVLDEERVYSSPIQIDYYLVKNGTIKVDILKDLSLTTSNDRLVIPYKILKPNDANKVFSEIQCDIINSKNVTVTTATAYNIPNNSNASISFGILPAGAYTVKWHIKDGATTTIVTEAFSVQAGADYVNGETLLLYFNAVDKGNDNSKWKAVEGTLKDNIHFDLFGGYEWKEESSNNDKTTCAHLNLKPNGYANLNGYSNLATYLNNKSEFSLELYYKATDIGELKAPVITTAKANNEVNGITLYHNLASLKAIGNAQKECETQLTNNKWNHIVFVITKRKHTPVKEGDFGPADRVEDNEYYSALKIYLNGCVVKCVPLTSDFLWSETYNSLSQLVLNGYLTTSGIAESGQSQYELIRIYDKGLSASEVLLNYKHALQYDKNDTNSIYKEVVERNNDTSIAKIFFIKNKTTINNNPSKTDFTYITFDDVSETVKGLHSIKKKKKETEADKGPFSKTSAVNCTAYLIQEGLATKYSNIDVYLQGTSSLEYPVKNYQVKNYNALSPGSKSKFLPAVKEVTADKNWGGDEGDYVYTLKCDYMEHSHKNNTPTAVYYDTVLDNIIDGNVELYSPPRQKEIAGGDIVKNEIYRDSITGFPVIVYYSDNDSIQDLTLYEGTEEGLENTLAGACKNTGSYMFNIDKEGKALGFEVEEISENLDPNIYYFPLVDYYVSIGNWEQDLEDDLDVLKCRFEDELPTTNIADLNALNLHFYGYGYKYTTGEGENIVTHTDKYCHIIDHGAVTFRSINDIIIEGKTHKECVIEVPNHAEYGSPKNNGLIPFCLSSVIEYQKPESGYCVSLEGTANSQEFAAATFYTINEANQDRAERNKELPPSQQLSIYANKFKYYEATLEPRYSYADEEKYDDERRLCCDYEKLDECVKFFKIISTDKTLSDAYKKERFEQLFSKEYCLTYYLQMQVFTQVDNAGKNAMFDCWNGGKLFPRPYDMDTQMGLDNVGQDNVPSSAELEASSNSGEADFGIRVDWRYKGEGKATDPNEQRLTSYNTRNSKLWGFIAKTYEAEILELYTRLRGSVYTEETICNAINALTSKIISEEQYNKDAVLKYLLPYKKEYDTESQEWVDKKQTDYFYVLAGNRNDRYRQFIKERLIFLDSVYEIGNYTNTLYMRAEASQPNNIINWQFSPMSPQYITVISGAGKAPMKFYVAPNMEYEVTSGVYEEGVSLTYTNLSTNRETWIYGLNNLKFVKGLASAAPSTITGLSNGTKLNTFDLQSAPTALTLVDLSDNTYLNKVTINNCLGISSVSLTKAKNLKELELQGNTNLTSLSLPDTAPLTKINLTNNTNLQTLKLTNLPNLTSDNLILTGCNSLYQLEIVNCPQLSSIDLTAIPGLKTVIIDNCDTLSSFTCNEHKKLESLTISNCDNLETVSLKKSVLVTLGLGQNNPKLKSVDLRESIKLESLGIASQNEEGLTLKLHGCEKLSRINSETPGEYNFACRGKVSGTYLIEKVVELNCYNNDSLVSVKDLNYHGPGASTDLSGTTRGIFDSCAILTSFKNTTLKFKNTMYRAFAYNSELSALAQTSTNTDLILDHDTSNKVTNMYMAFYSTGKFNCKIPQMLDKFVKGNNQLTSLNYAFVGCGGSTDTNNNWTLGNTVFTQCTALTNLAYAFSGTKLKTISTPSINTGSPNLGFNGCTELSYINQAFGNNKIESIPENLFVNCTKLESARYLFAYNTNLTTLPAQMFSANTIVDIDIEAIFQDCTALPSLQTVGASEINQINRFILNITRLKNANKAFINTGITAIENGIFNNASHLQSARCMFSNCTQLEVLPKQLKTIENETPEDPELDLGGLFGGCKKLQGLIPMTLFDNLRGRITSLGWARTSSGGDAEGLRDRTVGAFANTQLSGYEIKQKIIEGESKNYSPFTNMSKLQDISFLFAHGNISRTVKKENDGKDYYYFTATEIDDSEFDNRFKGWGTYADDGVTFASAPNGQIGFAIFEGCDNIEQTLGVFMGTDITSIEDDPSATNKLPLFGQKTDEITDISLLFYDSDLQNCDGLNSLLAIMPNVEVAQYTFAKTQLSDIDSLLDTQTKLTNLQGIFAGCINLSNTSLSNEFFRNHTNIQNVSYAFANTNITQIVDPQPTIYMFDTPQVKIIITPKSGNDIVLNQSNDNQYLTIENTSPVQRITNTMLNSSLQLVLTSTDGSNTSNYTIEVKTIKLQFVLASEDKELGTHNYYHIYGSDILAPRLNKLLLSLTKEEKEAHLIQEGNNIYSYNLYNSETTTTSVDPYVIAIYKSLQSSADESLFRDCTDIETTEGMFYNTQITTLPNYIFSNEEAFSELTNIGLMFGECKKCVASNNIDVSSGELLTPTWVSKCPAITNINGLLLRLGTDIATLPNNYKLGASFDVLQNLHSTECAFALMGSLISNTDINSGFLYNSLKTLRKCKGIFANTNLSSITEVFNGNANGNNIETIDWGFAYTSPNPFVLPYYSRFPTKVSCKDTWFNTSKPASVDYNTWPAESKNIPANQDSDTITGKVDNWIADNTKLLTAQVFLAKTQI